VKAVIIIASILILGTLGLSQNAFAAGGTISNQNSCTALGLTWLAPSHCFVYGELTINEGENLTVVNIIFQVQPSGTIINHGTIDNSGTLDIRGTIDNSGTIDNAGTIINSKGTIINGGTINNSGTININYSDSILDIRGTINNSGTISNGGTIISKSGSTINNSGTIDNFGIINNNDEFNNKDTITNSGTINNNSGGTITNSGTIDNNGEFNNKDTITNSGTITNGDTITNSGIIDNGCDGRMDGRGVVGNLPVDVCVPISDQASCEAFGLTWVAPNICQVNDALTMGARKTLTISSGIILEITSTGTININSDSILDIRGTITNSGTINNSGTITNSGIIDNGCDGQMAGRGVVGNLPINFCDTEGDAPYNAGTSEYGISEGDEPDNAGISDVDLAVVMTSDSSNPGTIYPGSSLSFNVRGVNNAIIGTNAVVSIGLSSGLHYDDQGSDCIKINNQIRCFMEPLNAGSVFDKTLAITVNDSAVGTQSITAIISSVNPDPQPNNDQYVLDFPLAQPTTGQTQPRDTTPPKILKPTDITIDAENNNGARVSYDVLVIDETDKIVRPSCSPSSGSFFEIGETRVRCNASDLSGNRAQSVSFSITVNPPDVAIPDWVKNMASFWCDDKIDIVSFIEGIQYLIDNNIIIVSESSGYGSSQYIPNWVKNNACWWSQGLISNGDFASGIEYLVREGIIRV